MFCAEEIYKFLSNIIDSSKSNLTKKILYDNIFTIVTTHDNEVSRGFFQYYKYKKIEKYLNRRKLFKNKTKIIFGSISLIFRIIVKKRAIWRILNKENAPILLIYIPNEKYFDVGIPIYDEVRKKLNIMPIVVYESRSHIKSFKKYKHINITNYSPGIKPFFNILNEIKCTKNAVLKEEQYCDFYSFVYSHLWTSQLFNLINRQILRNLFRNNTNIKAVFSCIPTTNFGKLLNITAEEYHIPTISIRRGITFHNIENYFIETKYLLAKGEHESGIYRKSMLADKSEIEVVGAPFLKEQNYDVLTTKRKICNKIVILFIDQPLSINCDMVYKKELVNKLCKIIKDFPNLELLIKLHPGTKQSDIYKEQFQKNNFSNYRIYKLGHNLNEAIIESDCTIVHNSTVSFNVLLMRKPLIVLGNTFFKGGIQENIFYNKKIAYIAEDEKALRDVLDQISKRTLRKKSKSEIDNYLKYHIKYFGKNATNKIVDFLRKRVLGT